MLFGQTEYSDLISSSTRWLLVFCASCSLIREWVFFFRDARVSQDLTRSFQARRINQISLKILINMISSQIIPVHRESTIIYVRNHHFKVNGQQINGGGLFLQCVTCGGRAEGCSDLSCSHLDGWHHSPGDYQHEEHAALEKSHGEVNELYLTWILRGGDAWHSRAGTTG